MHKRLTREPPNDGILSMIVLFEGDFGAAVVERIRRSREDAICCRFHEALEGEVQVEGHESAVLVGGFLGSRCLKDVDALMSACRVRVPVRLHGRWLVCGPILKDGSRSCLSCFDARTLVRPFGGREYAIEEEFRRTREARGPRLAPTFTPPVATIAASLAMYALSDGSATDEFWIVDTLYSTMEAGRAVGIHGCDVCHVNGAGERRFTRALGNLVQKPPSADV